MPSSSVEIYALTTATIVFLAVYSALQRAKKGPYPPGPRGLPVFGSFFDPVASGDYQWLEYEELAHKYRKCSSVIGLEYSLLRDVF